MNDELHDNFNPRLHTEATSMEKHEDGKPVFQSTPPSGGAGLRKRLPIPRKYFNPRLHTEATRCKLLYVNSWIFQSTPPYGGDRLPL